jgi:predicted nucleotidyltransferase
MGRLAAALPIEELQKFCSHWNISTVALFGSSLRDDFGPESDIDVLVTFASGDRHTLLDEAQMEMELEAIFDRKVDLTDRAAVEQSSNEIRKRSILDSAQTIYESG